jgi:hypothetical protein
MGSIGLFHDCSTNKNSSRCNEGSEPIKIADSLFQREKKNSYLLCRNLWLAIFYLFTILLYSRNQNLGVEVFIKITRIVNPELYFIQYT